MDGVRPFALVGLDVLFRNIGLDSAELGLSHGGGDALFETRNHLIGRSSMGNAHFVRTAEDERSPYQRPFAAEGKGETAWHDADDGI